MQEKEIGKITHYYGHLSVGIIELSDTLKTGDSIHIKVSEAKAGDIIGIKVIQKVHPHDKVYKVIA
jgi:putative protease